MSILDSIKDFAKNSGINLDDGLGLDDLTALGGKLGDIAEQYGLTPEELGAKLGDLKNLAADKAGDLDLASLASKVGLPEDLVNKVLGGK